MQTTPRIGFSRLRSDTCGLASGIPNPALAVEGQERCRAHLWWSQFGMGAPAHGLPPIKAWREEANSGPAAMEQQGQKRLPTEHSARKIALASARPTSPPNPHSLPPRAPCCGTISMSPSALARQLSSMLQLAVYMWMAKPFLIAALHAAGAQGVGCAVPARILQLWFAHFMGAWAD